MLQGTHHVAVICSDEGKTLDFYVNKLGFTLERECWREPQGDYLRMLRHGDTVIELFVKPNAPQRPSDPEALGLRHLAFRVENVDEAVEWLNARGIETEPVREDSYNGGRLTFFHDPDGLPLEVHE
ncbi:MAG: VOC family protein [Faecousia sp.]